MYSRKEPSALAVACDAEGVGQEAYEEVSCVGKGSLAKCNPITISGHGGQANPYALIAL